MAFACSFATILRMKDHYRVYLNEDFKTRCEKNSRYTLRAYAQFLEIDSGTLSKILSGKRKLPKTHWMSTSSKLKLKPTEKQNFLQSLWDEQGIASVEDQLVKRNAKLLSSENYFEIISEWEFAVSLCLFDLKNFTFTVQNIAKYLGLTQKRANEIYAKLFQFGLVEMVGDKIVRTTQSFESTEDVMSKALQRSHENDLKLAISKLHSVNLQEREFTTLTFAGNSKDIKKMKLWIRSKRQEFDRLFESQKADQVFQFAIQFFPLTTKVEK